MISDIGPGASVAMLTRSLQGLADILRSSNEQSLNLANNLLRAQVQEKIADVSLGAKIDTQA
ncbi:MAG TPA: hypothetical protein VMV03_12950 [Spirochaetia bacterium]|nr:hypothetical protein [Spirochaetia bacterium]